MGEVPVLEGVWVTGKTFEGWVVFRLRRGLVAPPIGACRIEEPERPEVSG